MAASHPHSLRSPRLNRLAFCLLSVLAGFGTARADDSVATGKLVLDPGGAAFAVKQGTESFGNAAIEARWKLDGKHLVDMTVTDRVHNRTFAVPAPFALVMADGSARRSAKGPGYLDERAETYDAAVTKALASSDLDGLAGIDETLAAELLVGGVGPLKALAGLARGATWRAEVLYDAAPYGVQYTVVSWSRA